ncbi:hypothetical protein PCASD_22702 [Puccinia coronata f. sp. avenae]|uniref:Uncharacterized protein n=1 Tax=Puccinia coronata f. sp. avenae TaxID=200324 RepID=A0A2N5TT95_9BASI|nr:hypothetical protein PCASD_22702 [Puccinia coronata f. sp. avenae]
MGPFDIFELSKSHLTKGSNYGQFTYQSSIAYHDSNTNEEVNICVDLSGYGSKSTTPSLDKVYYLAGRFVGMTEAPIIFFEQQMSLQIGSSEAYMSALAGKVAVWGMGIVVNRSEFQTPGMNNVLQTNLRITIQHMDYHNINRGKVDFKTCYIIPGNRILGPTHPLFQVGREFLINGYVSGYNHQEKVWEVTALLLSLLSGTQNHSSSASRPPASTNPQRRANLKRLGPSLANTSGSNQAVGPSSGSLAFPPPAQHHNSVPPNNVAVSLSSTLSVRQSNPDNSHTEDGEVTDHDPDPPFKNTYPAGMKRTSKDILTYAKKAIKQRKN